MPYVNIDHGRLYYQDSGNGTAVVFLHAAAGNADSWYQQVPVFNEAGFRTITYDMRGYGRSKCDLGQEGAGSAAADLEKLLAALSVERVAVIGQAMGGFGALEYTIDHPDTVSALIVSTSFGGLTDPKFLELRERHVLPDLMQRPVFERELGKSYIESNPEGVRRFIAIEEKGFQGGTTVMRQRNARPNSPERLASICTPTLVIAADEDLYAPPVVMQFIADSIPGARMEVIEGAGHSAYWEKPDQWNKLAIDFLKQHQKG